VGYLDELVGRRGSVSDLELIFELHAALQEAAARPSAEAPRDAQRRLRLLCRYAVSDGIAKLLRGDRAAVVEAARFAKEQDLPETARILNDALAGVPVPGPARVTLTLPGEGAFALDAAMHEWGATDLALSIGEEDFAACVMDFVSEHREEIAIPPHGSLPQRSPIDAAAAAQMAGRRPAELLAELLAHRAPRIVARLSEYHRRSSLKDVRVMPVVHSARAPADAGRLAQLRSVYGAVAEPLLEIYQRHDGLELFRSKAGPAFVFAPLGEWHALLQDAITWAETVIWRDRPNAVPGCLRSAIAFGYIPGDAERWLLITQGQHAGTIMLSETDLVDDEPRMQSLAELLWVMIHDAPRVIGSGGYVSYTDPASGLSYYPERYEHDG
jgi:hypothetical protein